MPLTREQIQEASRSARIDREKMVVPEFGDDGIIWVRGMSAREQDKIEESFRIKSGKKQGQIDASNFRAAMAAKVIVTDAGERLCADNDADWLGRFKPGTLDRIIAKARELSGATEEEADESYQTTLYEQIFRLLHRMSEETRQRVFAQIKRNYGNVAI